MGPTTTRAQLTIAAAIALLIAACTGARSQQPDPADAPVPAVRPPTTVTLAPSAPGVLTTRCELDPERFAVLTPSPVTPAEASAAGCGTLDATRTWWAVRAGVDREQFTALPTPGQLSVVLVTPGPECPVTMEYRGELVLLVTSESAPELSVERRQLPC